MGKWEATPDGVELAVVVKELAGVQELRALTGFGGEVYLDEAHALYKAIGAQVMGMEGFENKKVIAHGARCKAKGVVGNMEGEGTQLGGLIVGGPAAGAAAGARVEFCYVEQEWGDHAVHECWDQLLQACMTVDGDGASGARL